MTREIVLAIVALVLFCIAYKLDEEKNTKVNKNSGVVSTKKGSDVETTIKGSLPGGEELPKILDNKGELRQILPTDPYIKPVEFKVGFINNNGKTANLGDETTWYPINGLGVQYGNKMGTNFPQYQFIRSI